MFAIERVQRRRVGVECGVVHENDGMVALSAVGDEVLLQLLPVGRGDVAEVGHDAARSWMERTARRLQGLSVASTPMKQ